MGEIFNISSSLPFLDTLAAGVLARFENLGEIIIFLPNRRATRPLAESFFKLAGEKSIILPKIQVIGDVDEEGLYLKYFPDFEKIPPAITPTARLYEIARLIHEKQDVDFAQSVALAKSLIQLVDELQNKNLELDALKNVVPEDFAEHWQITLDFLKIISEDWQAYLQRNNVLEPIHRRNLLIEKLADFYHRELPKQPVIIAGTTGSIPSTVSLVKSVLAGANGYLVLDGLDRNLQDEDFKIIDETHPQFNLNQLLVNLSTTASAVEEWQEAEITERQKLISTALFPTELTPRWKNYKCHVSAQDNLHMIEAANLEEEAMAIAVALREVLEHESKTAMVVTNNRALTERIAAKMRIWNVEINDSAGQNLVELPTSRFLLELVEMLRSRQAPVELLSFFKHPFVPLELKTKIREIELEHLRGPRLGNFDISKFDIEIPKFKELAALFKRESAALTELFKLHVEVAENIVTREVLWGRQGLEVYEYMQEFRGCIAAGHKINPQLYPEVLAQFMATKTYRPDYGLNKRINIFPPAEARMQNANVIIIAGMNEGNFPPLSAADSFMNIEIRKKIGLDLPSRVIGKAAHDFELLSQAEQVIYTRSIKEQGSPAVKSRFLQRLAAVCEIQDGGRYCGWAKDFYEPPHPPQATKRPEPKPPLEARPRELSATRVGKLMRDPYVVYAEKILRLYKLDDIDAEVTNDKFGNFIHKALEVYALQFDGKLETLLAIGAKEFRQYEDKPAVRIFWWPKFLRIAEWFVENERRARASGREFCFEEKGEVKAGLMKFTAKADRIEVDEEIKIVDYKTGNPPSFDMVDSGLDPQLAIEAIIFAAKFGKKVSGLEYWYLKGRDEVVKIKTYKNSIDEMAAATQSGLENLAAAFLDEKTPFIARPWSRFALKYNDYEHLARIKEWDE